MDLDVALPKALEWTGRATDAVLQAAPGAPGVLAFLDDQDRVVNVLSSQHLRRLAATRLAPPETDEPSRRTDLGAIVRKVRYRVTRSAFESQWWYWQVTRWWRPGEYRKLLGFGPVWFLWFDASGAVPQIKVTERIWRDGDEMVGPWGSRREAQQALDGLIDLFDLCRYPEQVRRAPRGQACAYADMGRCDAPCDGSVPLEAYRERMQAAWRYACDGPSAWLTEARRRMQAAATELAFEQAALLKEQCAFSEQWLATWGETLRAADRLRLLLAIPVTRRKAFVTFLFDRGALIEGLELSERKLRAQATADERADDSAEHSPTLLLRACKGWLAAATRTSNELDPTERMEQTWLTLGHLFRRGSDRSITVWLDA